MEALPRSHQHHTVAISQDIREKVVLPLLLMVMTGHPNLLMGHTN
jgi:hypothetical protein